MEYSGQMVLGGFIGSLIVGFIGFSQIGIRFFELKQEGFVRERCNTMGFILDTNRVDSFKQFGGAIIDELAQKKGMGATQLTT